MMSRDFIDLRVSGGFDDTENISTKTQNISDKRTFSDLLEIAKGEIRAESCAIYNEDDRIIYVSGTECGDRGKNIKAVVQENYSIADICFEQQLFKSEPMIEIVFNCFNMDFSFAKGKVQRCNLQYLHGSKSYGKYFMNGIMNKEQCFEHKLTQKYLRDRFAYIMENDSIVLTKEYCAVFIVHPHNPIKGDVMPFLDADGLVSSTKSEYCKDAILFRKAKNLNTSLENCLAKSGDRSLPLKDEAIYLLLFQSEIFRSMRRSQHQQ